MIETYSWSGGSEHILRFGHDEPIQIIMAAPFFEEANRLRQVITNIMRSLAAHGIGCSLPDLPGTGESLTNIGDISFDCWRSALAGASDHIRKSAGNLLVASFRSGALIDDASGCSNVWRLAPETGARLVRDLMRTRLTGAKDDDSTSAHVDVAGHVVRRSLLDALSVCIPATTGHVRAARLRTDAAQADILLPGSPVWRRSEPGDDPQLRTAIVSDIVSWAKSCA